MADDKYIKAATDFIKPMIDALDAMPVEQAVDIMQGFYASNEDNCPWFVCGLKHTIPPMIAISMSASERVEEYEAEWQRRAGIDIERLAAPIKHD